MERAVTAVPTSPNALWRFYVGDCAALAVSSAIATWAMLVAHEHVANAGLASAVGMLGAMLASTLFASGAAFVLGSIETKVPAMLGGMISPMLVCTFGAGGRMHHPSGLGGVSLGAGVGFALALALLTYGRRCRRDFAQGRWHR